jgi:hypothetical protein
MLRDLHIEEIHDLCSSPDISGVILSRNMKWAGHVACMGKREKYTFFLGKSKGQSSVKAFRKATAKTLEINYG